MSDYDDGYIDGVDSVRGEIQSLQADLEQMRGERDEALAQSEHRRNIIREYKPLTRKLEAQVTTLREALDKYGRHLPDCDANKLRVPGSTLDGTLYQDCNCGFQAALNTVTGDKGDMRICEYCGCRTNAKARRCCEKGMYADRDDMVLVPREPTENMLYAAHKAAKKGNMDLIVDEIRAIYKAMINVQGDTNE